MSNTNQCKAQDQHKQFKHDNICSHYKKSRADRKGMHPDGRSGRKEYICEGTVILVSFNPQCPYVSEEPSNTCKKALCRVMEDACYPEDPPMAPIPF